jgi:AcrR family transcriptional regulator
VPASPPQVRGRGYARARARTRATLLAAAREVMAGRGVEGATIADVAARAGVSPGTFYNYFPDVPALVDALVDELVADLDRVISEVMDEDLTPLERLAVGIDRVLRLPEQDPTWAWCLIRFEPTVDRLRQALCERVARVPAPSRRASTQRDAVNADVLIGTMMTSMLSRLQGRADSTQNHLVVEAVLRALGLPEQDARAATAVVRRR